MRLSLTSSTSALALALALLPTVFANKTITIHVGAPVSATGGPVQFVPPNVTASIGSVITFNFSGLIAGNHTVTQSSFDTPCQPLKGGFNSGYVYIPNDTISDFPLWNLTIKDSSKPIWFSCQQISPVFNEPHCFGPMVGAINAPTSGSQNFTAFQQVAKSATLFPPQNTSCRNFGYGAFAHKSPEPLPSGGAVYCPGEAGGRPQHY